MALDPLDDLRRALLGRNKGGRLENWSIKKAFLTEDLTASGEIYGDPRCNDRFDFHDGKVIYTTALEEINIESNYIITRNTLYELGEPSPHQDMSAFEEQK